MRIAVAAQMAVILVGLLFIQFPYIALFTDGTGLSIYEYSAPEATMKVLFWSLMIGILFIFPAHYYLFKIFKVTDKEASVT